MSKPLKPIVATAFAALVLSGLIAGCGPDKKEEAAKAAQTASVESPEGKIQKAVIDEALKGKTSTLDKVEINRLDKGFNVNIWAHDDGQGDKKLSKSVAQEEALRFIAAVQNSGEPIARAAYIYMDVDGKKKLAQAEVTADQAKKVDWKNYGALNADRVLTWWYAYSLR